MKLALLLGSNLIGGTESQMIQLALQLKEINVSARIFYFKKKYWIQNKVNDKGLDSKNLFATRYSLFLSRLYFLALSKIHRIDVVYCFDAEQTDFVVKTFKNSRIKIVVGIRNNRFNTNNNKVNLFVKNRDRINYVICNSTSILESLTQRYIFAGVPTQLINNGVVRSEKDNDERPFDTFNIFYVGRLEVNKNPIFFLKLANSLIEKGMKVRFHIIGDGSEYSNLKDYVKTKNLSSVLSFYGSMKKSEIPYSKADLLVNCSFSEGTSNSILEAMSYGVPVIASNVPGNRELLINFEGAKLVDISLEKFTNEAISFIHVIESKRIEIGKACIGFIEKGFSMDKMVKDHLDVFQKVYYD